MDIRIDIENDVTDELIDYIEGGIQKALAMSGGYMERSAKWQCHVNTGRLRNSITYSVDPLRNEVYIGTNVEYAIYHHEGTYKTKANRFLTDVLERKKKDIATSFCVYIGPNFVNR